MREENMRKFIIASHGDFAKGIVDSAELLTGNFNTVYTICAFKDESVFETLVEEIMSKIDEEDEVIVLTDIIHGSLTQYFMTLTDKYNLHVIAGVNFPLVLSLFLFPQDQKFTPEIIQDEINQAQTHIKYN